MFDDNHDFEKNLTNYIFLETFWWFVFLINFICFFVVGVALCFFLHYLLIVLDFNFLFLKNVFNYLSKIVILYIHLISALIVRYFVCPPLRQDLAEGFDLLLIWMPIFPSFNFILTFGFFWFFFYLISNRILFIKCNSEFKN